MIEIVTRICKICNIKKDISCFNRQAKRCLECIKLHEKNKIERLREYTKSPKVRFKKAQLLAKKRSMEWNISYFDYCMLIERKCYYCENVLKHQKTGVGLDRIDCKKGYSLENVLPCCGICNLVRKDIFTVKETRAMVAALISCRNEKEENS